jgi:hypothetical protein
MFYDDDKKTTEPEQETTSVPKEEEASPKKRRGFAAMDQAKVRAIARKGGAASHARGTAHRFTSEEARAAENKLIDALNRNTTATAALASNGGLNRGVAPSPVKN